MNHTLAGRSLGLLLSFAAVWVAALPLVVAGSPGLTALLPSHSHATLRGVVAPHTHAATTTDDRRCVATSPAAEAIACGADATAAFAALLPGSGPAAIIVITAMLTSRLTEPPVHRAPAPGVTTSPPRG
jgi:hypothetical protein